MIASRTDAAKLTILLGLLAFGISANAQEPHENRQNVFYELHRSDSRSSNASAEGSILIATREEATAQLAEAGAAAGSGREEEALRLYRDTAERWPEEGIPALARHLYLMDLTAELAEFESSMLKRTDLAPLTIARAYASMGKPQQAIELLSEGNDSSPATTLYRHNLLLRENRTNDAYELLWQAVSAGDDPTTLRLYARELLKNPDASLKGHPLELATLVDSEFRAMSYTRDRAVRLFDPAILALQHMDNYMTFREELVQPESPRGPGEIWLAGRILVREERYEEAAEYLARNRTAFASDPSSAIILGELAALRAGAGAAEDADMLLEQAAELSPSRVRSPLLLDSAELAIGTGRYAEAGNFLRGIDESALDRDRLRRMYLALVAVDAAQANLGAIVSDFSRIAPKMRSEEVPLLLQIIFKHLTETTYHVELERLARKRLAEDPTLSPEVWLLVAGAAHEARRKPNELEALYRYTLARPDSVAALDLLSAEVTNLTRTLLQTSPDQVLATEEEVENVFSLFEQTQRQLCLARPYDPEPFKALIGYFTARGEVQRGIDFLHEVVMESGNPTLIANGGYILSTSGHPEEGLKMYDAALAIEPREMNVRMNRASCLTRLGRFDEARDFHRKLLEEGNDNRAFHVHVQIENLWRIAENTGTQDECAAYFEKIAPTIPAEWRREAIMIMGHQMAEAKRPLDAERFYMIVANDLDDPNRIDGWESVLLTWEKAGNDKRTAELFDLARESFADDEEIVASLTMFQASLQMQSGETESADQLLASISGGAQDGSVRLNAIFRRGQLAEESGQLKEAADLYRQYLDITSREFGFRREAKERMGRIEEQLQATNGQ